MPYAVNFLDVARWFCVVQSGLSKREFRLAAGSDFELWSGIDVVDLFSSMQRKCLSYSLSDALITDLDTQSTLFLDQYQRFSAFSANTDIIKILYPFDRDVMWENFALHQEPDEDDSLEDIFTEIHSQRGEL